EAEAGLLEARLDPLRRALEPGARRVAPLELEVGEPARVLLEIRSGDRVEAGREARAAECEAGDERKEEDPHVTLYIRKARSAPGRPGVGQNGRFRTRSGKRTSPRRIAATQRLTGRAGIVDHSPPSLRARVSPLEPSQPRRDPCREDVPTCLLSLPFARRAP